MAMYDAMPAVWKYLSVEKQQAGMQTIGRFYRDSSFNEKYGQEGELPILLNMGNLMMCTNC